MDTTNLILTGMAPLPTLPEQTKKTDAASDAEKEQSAKDFESVFIGKLLDEMKNTVVDWSDEKDGASQQIDGIFYLYLARDIADKGGLGMWKDIYKMLTKSENKNTALPLIDKKL